MKKRVFVIAPFGMLGNAVVHELEKSDKISLTLGSDWRFPRDKELHLDYDYIVNCAGKIKSLINEKSNNDILEALNINAVMPLYLITNYPNTKIISPLTDCDFDGSYGVGVYNEEFVPNAQDIYGITKSFIARSSVSINAFGLRSSIIGFERSDRKRSLVEWFHNQPYGAALNGYVNHIWNGVTVNAWAKVIRGYIEKGLVNYGIQHLVPADKINKYELLCVLREVFGRPDIIIKRGNGPTPVDRSLFTLYKEANALLWDVGGYSKIPTIKELVQEMYLEKINFPERFSS